MYCHYPVKPGSDLHLLKFESLYNTYLMVFAGRGISKVYLVACK
jgi:hypothetical protein